MKEIIKGIDDAETKAKVYYWLAEAIKMEIDDRSGTINYQYIKGYADCKIKQLG